MTKPIRPLTGRELNEQHKAMVDAGVDTGVVLRWLKRETDLWMPRRASENKEPGNG